MATFLTSCSILQNKQQNVTAIAMVPSSPPISTISLPISPPLSLIACVTAANGRDDGQIGSLLPLLKYICLKMQYYWYILCSFLKQALEIKVLSSCLWYFYIGYYFMYEFYCITHKKDLVLP